MKISEINVSYSTGKEKKTKIKNSKQSYDVLLACWNKFTLELQEEFKVLLLNRNNLVLGIYSLSKGGVSSTIVDAKLLFSVALKCNASSIIISHNHPSGNVNPSEADIALTKKIRKAGKYLDIVLLDHIIVTTNGYFSFSDNGYIK